MSEPNTQVMSLYAVFQRTHPVIVEAIRAIRAIKDDAFDERLLEEDRVVLSLDTSGDSQRLTLSLGAAFTSVSAPRAVSAPIELTSALPTRRTQETLLYHSNGKITEGDEKTVVAKDEDKAGYIALPRVIINAIGALGLKLD